ncbi:MAG TPA: ECF-type sigma factor, partial [candidate division Zixibacteria bacterium]|nr:ECF-type sigma factor [candidate division Zixibacteria bacterium]
MDEEITKLLAAARAGDSSAHERLLPLVYADLKRRAHNQLRGERPDHTLNTTALVHEAYLKLVGQRESDWQSRRHFLNVASQAMRRILIDHARARVAEKRGGANIRTTFNEELIGSDDNPAELLALDRALTELEKLDPRQAQIVQLQFFGGLTQEEISQTL